MYNSKLTFCLFLCSEYKLLQGQLYPFILSELIKQGPVEYWAEIECNQLIPPLPKIVDLESQFETYTHIDTYTMGFHIVPIYQILSQDISLPRVIVEDIYPRQYVVMPESYILIDLPNISK